MVTGFSIFLVPAFRVNASWAAVAFLVGAVGLAYGFIRTFQLILDRGLVLVRRSKVFFLVILLLTLVAFWRASTWSG